MDYSKTRCSICLKRFCCIEHKNAHLKREHPDSLRKTSQQCLLKAFQKKAEQILINAKKYKAHNRKNDNQTTKTQNIANPNTNESRSAIKRRHSEINMQLVSTSIMVTSEIRKILVPTHRSKIKSSSNYELKPKSKASIEMKNSSPCDIATTIVKTSTPIINEFSVHGKSPDSWNISQTSSISSYQTPSGINPKSSCSIYETPSNSNDIQRPEYTGSSITHTYPSKKCLASPRSIMSKASKYNNELGPFVNPNVSAKFRRVTFSFGSSTNSSPLESVEEVEVYKETENECVFYSDGDLKNNAEVKHLSEYPEEIVKPVSSTTSDILGNISMNSSPSEKTKSGFFDCVTNMICSAVPIFSSWRSTNDLGSRSKRARSPESKFGGVKVSQSPEYKRLCYPVDLRVNPIKARKSISQK